MKTCTEQNVRQFILNRYAAVWIDRIIRMEDIPDTFDLRLEGVIDSLGVLELFGAIEEFFEVELDLQGLAAEEVTVIGPLARFVAQAARPKLENGAWPEADAGSTYGISATP